MTFEKILPLVFTDKSEEKNVDPKRQVFLCKKTKNISAKPYNLYNRTKISHYTLYD